ncbi:MAG: Peptidase protein [Thermoleophilia bacterium]|nr:Peptidase protein [Thermoleophilia bacterium]
MTRRFGTFAVFSAAVGLTLTSGAFTATPREEQASGLRQQLPAGIKQAKLDSRLAGVARAHTAGGLAAAVAAARAAGLHVKNGRVRAVMVASSKAPAEAAARAHGGAIEGAHGKRVQVLLPPGALDAVSKNPYVEYLRPPLTHLPEAVPGEGVAASGATPWIAAGRKGAGVKVAVVDLGFAGYAERQAEGELPASLTTVDYCDGEFATEEVHGTAVAEIVHEMAPDAELTLICINTEVALGAAEEYAEANGIRVINHSVGWFNAVRGDGTGGAGTIDGVVADARAAGILWVNSAGNQSEDHWSASFNDTDGNGVHNYTSTDEGNTFLVPEGQAACATLKWDSWPTTNQDFDLYVAHSATGALVAASTNLQNGSQTPTEEACFVNTSFDDSFFIAIDRFATTTKPRLDVVVNGGYFLQYQVAAGSINELAASPNTFAVAAICWQSNALESFSSRGPTIDGRIKPDISGHDAVSNATYGPAGGCGTAGFLGTSAAAPHVAGAAALVLGQSPGYSVTQLQGALTSAAVDMGASGKDNSFGSGRLRVPLILAPAVTSMTPGSAVAGTAVVLGGSAFTGATSVTFNGVPATTFTVNSATKITAVVPSSATMGPMQVTTPDGFGQSATPFKPTPKLTLASPSPAQAGDALTITGTNLAGASALKLGSLTLPLDSVTATEVQTTLPASGAVTNNLAATTPAGQSAGLKLGIRPSISGFTPASAPAGTQITLDGQTFTGTTKVSFGSASASATFTVVSTTQLKATVPSAAVTGPLTVTNAGGTTLSADSFGVLAKVSSFSPASGVAGTQVTMTGTGLIGATSVKFNGVEATATSSVTATSLKATVPPGATSGPITVTTPSGVGTSGSSFTIPLAITGFSPASGQVGDTVTIIGAGFLGLTGVKFGDATASGTIDSDTQITVTVPPGATDGPIVVANGSVSVPSAASFDVIVVTVTSQRIVFSTNRFGGTEIAVMNGDGSGLTRLTINSSGDLAPAWSPDGTKIAFASNRDGQWDIYVMNSDGSGQTRLTDRPATTDTSPTWSRDGSMIAFESNSGTDAEIWVMGADGSNPVQLTDSPLGWNQDPAWSPDGSKIAFTSTRDSSYEIYTMNPDGSAQVNVTNSTDISEGNPDWAPDGAKVVFGNLAVVPPQSQGINTVNSGGGGGTALTFSDDRHPSWSQCSRIVFVRFVVGAEREIFVMFDDGSAVQRLTQDQWADLEVDCWEPPGP